MMNSHDYGHLYKALFKPSTDGSNNLPSRLIVRADNTKRKSFAKGEKLKIFLTLIGNRHNELAELLAFLPELEGFHFFKSHHLSFSGYQTFNPQKNFFESSPTSAIAAIDATYITSKCSSWKHSLELRLLSPTSYFKDHILADSIDYNELLNRIDQRAYTLYYSYMANDTELIPQRDPIQSDGTCLINAISFPIERTLKRNSYDLSGLKGFVCYEAPYSYLHDFLFTLAHYIHIGSNTLRGNGQIQILALSDQAFAGYINKLGEASVEPELIRSLHDNSYTAAPYRLFNIPKTDGSYRQISIPDPKDLQLQKLMNECIYPQIDRALAAQCYAYRRGKGPTQAIQQLSRWQKELSKSHYSIRCDIDNFFDSIDQEILLKKVYTQLHDTRLYSLIQLWISSGKVDKRQNLESSELGIPQGAAISPLLANLYVSDFDRYIEKNLSPYFIRYADDLIILLPHKCNPLSSLQSLTDYLKQHLKLDLNKDFEVAPLCDGFSFLGIHFAPDGKLSMSSDKRRHIEKKVWDSLTLVQGKDFSALEQCIDGMKAYYGKLIDLDEQMEIDQDLLDIYRRYIADSSKKIEIAELVKLFSQHGFLTPTLRNGNWGKGIKRTKKKEKGNSEKETKKSLAQRLKLQKKRQLQELTEDFELVLSLPGSYIGIAKNRLQVKNNGKLIFSKPLNSIRQISILCDGISISSYITKYCAKKGIHINYIDPRGELYASISGPEKILPQNMQAQLELSDERKQFFIHKLIENKASNQLKLIKYYNKYYKKSDPYLGSQLQNCIDTMQQLLETLPSTLEYEALRQELFLWEAQFALIYWQGFRLLCQKAGYDFEKREHQHAIGLVNQLLNYGYAILASRIQQLCTGCHISPNISYLHSRSDSKPTLVFDLMEQYRSFVVDRSVLALLSKGEELKQEKNVANLSLDTRKKIIAQLNDRFYSVEQHKGKELLLNDLMNKLMLEHANYCRGKSKKPSFYKPKW